MALAQTTTFGQYILWVETDTPGTYENVCGLTSRGINRNNGVQEVPVPYCGVGEEDLPSVLEISADTQKVSISGSGVMSQQSHLKMYNWWKSAAKKNIRIERVGAASGEIRYENALGLLEDYNNAASKGEKVSAEISIRIDGTTTVTLAP